MRRAAQPSILVTHRIFPETRAMLATVGDVVAPARGDAWSAAVVRRHAHGATAMLAFMPDMVDDRFLADAPNLRIIAGALKGYDNFDASACAKRGVWLTVVPDLLTIPTAELTIGLMIALARRIRDGDRYVRSGKYRGWRPRLYGRGLAAETAGLVGMGAIGRAIAERLTAFGMRLVYTDPRPVSECDSPFRGERLPFDALLACADYVIVAAPLVDATVHLIDETRLAQMKPDAFLINPSRGSVVDEAAVAAALEADRLGGYAADAFEMEDWRRPDRPRTISKTLRHHPRTLFTPHLGSAVVAARHAIEQRAAANIIDYFEGRPPRDAVAGPPAPNRVASRRHRS
jgi:phosphonate dehydrogenase